MKAYKMYVRTRKLCHVGKGKEYQRQREKRKKTNPILAMERQDRQTEFCIRELRVSRSNFIGENLEFTSLLIGIITRRNLNRVSLFLPVNAKKCSAMKLEGKFQGESGVK